MSRLRGALKAAAEEVLGSKALAAFHGTTRRRRSLILAYHNVVPEPGGQTGDRSLHIGFDRFRRHLDLLTDRVVIASLDQVIGGKAESGSVAITFDDAYASAISLAFPELMQRGIPATIFIAPGLLGQGIPWWDAIANGDEGLEDETREFCLEELGGSTAPILEWARTQSSRFNTDTLCRIATAGELSGIRGSSLITIGAHSWSHSNLGRAGPEQLRFELMRVMPWLLENFPGQDRPWLAYPYGLYSDEVVHAAKGNGYQATFAIRGGWIASSTSADVFPRLNIPAGLSSAGLAARINGYLL